MIITLNQETDLGAAYQLTMTFHEKGGPTNILLEQAD